MLARLRAAFRPRPPARAPSVRVCAWCGGARRERGAPGDRGGEVTHGICPDCLEQELAALASKRAA